MTKKTARLEADASWKTTLEEVRRLENQQAANLGLAMASSSASGLQRTGSTATVISSIDRQQNLEKDWALKAGELNRKNIIAGGKSSADSFKTSSALSGVSSAANIGFNYWLGTKT